jgi:hypothetical protein
VFERKFGLQRLELNPLTVAHTGCHWRDLRRNLVQTLYYLQGEFVRKVPDHQENYSLAFTMGKLGSNKPPNQDFCLLLPVKLKNRHNGDYGLEVLAYLGVEKRARDSR